MKNQLFDCFWLELTATLVRHGGIYQETAARIAQTFLAWIKSTMIVENPTTHDSSCVFIFTLFEGMVLLNALGQKTTTSQTHE